MLLNAPYFRKVKMRVKDSLLMFYIKTCAIRINKFEIICSGQSHNHGKGLVFVFPNSETLFLNKIQIQII